MRLNAKPFAFVSAAVLAAVICACAGAGARHVEAAGHGRIASALASLASRSGPRARLHVIVQGPGAVLAAARAGRIDKRLGHDGVAATIRADQLRQLASRPGVSLVAPDARVTFTASSVSAANLATIFPVRDSASNPWNAGVTGSGVGIAVIDSGVSPSPDLGTRLVQVRLDGQDGSLDDTVGHGTLVAGVAAGQSADGRFIGIAPGATVYSLNVNRPDGVRTSDVITALKWVFDNAHTYNIRVVNLSLGETVKSSYTESPLDLAVERLWASGVFVDVAAGNRGAGEIDYAPANDPLVLTVGAFDTKSTNGPGDDTLLPWSSRGKTMDGFNKPELVAPGRHVAAMLATGSTYDAVAPAANRSPGGYVSANGTSFAAPQVAGAAAIIFQAHPDYSPDNLKWVLLAKDGAKPKSSGVGALSLSSSYNLAGAPGRANQGYEALVCAPGSTCLSGSTVASKWSSTSWNSSSWNSSSWNSSSWNSTSWNDTADWDSSSWNSSSWNTSSWNATGWNADGVDFDLWG
jgi:serine protease AprX